MDLLLIGTKGRPTIMYGVGKESELCYEQIVSETICLILLNYS
ncbi:hypothetical protein PUS82_11315 [Cytobacillus firmus]|uniref:Uncharacterized protein n=1 Tax=Cytobacillus firmus TaxID=1399 RepID=A0A800MUF4_CYTFI|nr:hypothetical protein [Cytobacillus firmus]KAF0822708.1 hypothetical protein KIS1582_3543 [Cytobacillus firmus]MDD9311873.1 hypothetical protein [Cytobacillus firmus]